MPTKEKRIFRHTKSSSEKYRQRRFSRPAKPPLALQTTTLWDYPSQHYGDKTQGDREYIGATPAYVIWNVISRYSKNNDLIVDPFCGSGTTLDVAFDLQRQARGFDLVSTRQDIEIADARNLPLPNNIAKVVFADPPYGNHIKYSDEPRCIGKLSPYGNDYYHEMDKVFRECCRILQPGGYFALYVCDFFIKKHGFAPVGFELFASLAHYLQPVDIIAVVRHNKSFKQSNFHKAAAEQNFFLRGFNYLFIAQKSLAIKKRR